MKPGYELPKILCVLCELRENLFYSEFLIPNLFPQIVQRVKGVKDAYGGFHFFGSLAAE